MPTSNNNSRTPKTIKKRTTAATASGETPTRKRASKKAAETTPVVAAGASSRTVVAERAPAAAPMTATSSATSPAVTPRSDTMRSVPVVTGARPDPVIAKVVDADERRRMIAEAAYHKFLQRGPGHGTPSQDWSEAEAEIDALLAEQRILRTQ